MAANYDKGNTNTLARARAFNRDRKSMWRDVRDDDELRRRRREARNGQRDARFVRVWRGSHGHDDGLTQTDVCVCWWRCVEPVCTVCAVSRRRRHKYTQCARGSPRVSCSRPAACVRDSSATARRSPAAMCANERTHVADRAFFQVVVVVV